MVTIRRGEKTFAAKPLPQEPEPSLGYLGFLVWEAVISCQSHRHQAIKLWSRMEKIQQHIDQQTERVDLSRFYTRISDLNNQFIHHQQRFLYWEDAIHSLWKNATPDQIVEEQIDELCNALPGDDSLPPLWHHRLGSQEGASPACTMTTTALQFSSAEMIRKYRKRAG